MSIIYGANDYIKPLINMTLDRNAKSSVFSENIAYISGVFPYSFAINSDNIVSNN